MNGQPVWLASLSTRDKHGEVIATGNLKPYQVREAEVILRKALEGVGDPSRERLFRMNITMCLHRAATDIEVATAPLWWQESPGCGIAGGPVAILWENTPASDSCKPCEKPGHGIIYPSRPDLWFPVDCGSCAPCVARAAC